MDQSELDELLSQPEGEELEFKAGEIRPEAVARILGAFANTRGGTLVWGFDERNRSVVGVSDVERAEHAMRRGLSLVTPQPDAYIATIDYHGVPLIVARVGRTPGHLYLANRELLERQGDRVRAMSSDRLARLAAVPRTPTETADETIRDNNKVLVDAVAALREDISALRKQNSLPRRAVIALGGAAFGALLRPVIALLS